MGKAVGAWKLALPRGGFLSLVYLLPWAYIAYDLIQSCHDTSWGFVSFEEIVNQGSSDKRTHHYGAFYSLYLDPLRLPRQQSQTLPCQQSPQGAEEETSDPAPVEYARKLRQNEDQRGFEQQGFEQRGFEQQPWEPREVNMLEIGLKYGDSLKLWKRAFPRGVIYGIDNEMISTKHQAEARDPRVRLMVGDQANGTFLEQVVAEIKSAVGLLDFIVDDGGHTMPQQQTSLQYLLPLVKPGGIYFLEDLETSYYTKCHITGCYEGGPPGLNTTTIHVLKTLMDVVNQDFVEKQDHMRKFGHKDFYATPVEDLVGAVHCMRNICALRRKSSPWY
ncbi:hypothetical protein CLOM_g16820 [Closterium sp. NIES-68]|nr:hypothetical protein CLOM_g16820 [Closterium sp. NIES-68]GJP75617.1 hypothetical protein CLOP_g6046 [Closterium sp. NIES-67]